MKRSLNQAGYEVRNSEKETVKEIAAWGEIVILAVPFIAMDNVVSKLGDSIDKKKWLWIQPTRSLRICSWLWVFQPAEQRSCKRRCRPCRHMMPRPDSSQLLQPLSLKSGRLPVYRATKGVVSAKSRSPGIKTLQLCSTPSWFTWMVATTALSVSLAIGIRNVPVFNL